MSDSANLLRPGPMSLSAGAPVIANPLAAIMAGNQAAASDYDLQAKQISRAAALHGMVGSMAADLMNDPSDENAAKIRASMVNAGVPQAGLAEFDRITSLPQAQRGAEAYKHVLFNLDALQTLNQTQGKTILQNVGGEIRPLSLTQPRPGVPGGMSVGPGSVPLGPSPETLWQLHDVWVPLDENGQVIPRNPDGSPSKTPARWAQGPVPRGNLPAPTGAGSPPAQPAPNAPSVFPPNYSGRFAPTAAPPPSGAPTAPTPANAPAPAGAPTAPPAPAAAPPGVQVGGPPPAPPGATAGAPVAGGFSGVLPPAAGGPAPAAAPSVSATPPIQFDAANAAVAQAKATGKPVAVPNGNGLTALPNGSLSPRPVPGTTPFVATPGPGASLVPGDVNAMMAGIQRAQGAPGGGAMTAGPGAPTEATPQAGWGTAIPRAYGPQGAVPYVPGAAPAPVTPAATPGAVRPGVIPGVITGPPQGQPARVEADTGEFVKDRNAIAPTITRAQNMAHAWEALQALQSSTGKGAAGLQGLRSFAQTIGIANAGTVDEATLVDLINKYTTRNMLEAAGGGSTNMGKEFAQESNAGTLLTKPANFEVLRSDMGLALQSIAAAHHLRTTNPSSDGAGYPDIRNDIKLHTDPRGFVWSMYSKSDQAKILDEIKGNPEALKKLGAARGLAIELGIGVPGATMTPPPQRQGFVAPSAPQQNMLQMTG